MPVHVHEDDWSGRSDPAVRRKIQNRLNQRARRRRKDALLQVLAPKAGGVSSPHLIRFRVDSLRIEYPEVQPPVAMDFRGNVQHSDVAVPRPADLEAKVSRWMSSTLRSRLPVNSTVKKTLIDIEEATSEPDLLCPLPADHLLTLVYYNILRALVSNTYSIGLNPDILCQEVLSPFTSNSFRQSSLLQLPPDLRPTSLQRTQQHHPYIDIFPCAGVRNNLLRAGDGFDEMELWMDVIGVESTTNNTQSSESYGMVVWGDPWNIRSWEVTEGFARKWSWVLQGCNELISSSNYWRLQRGDKPLILETTHCIEL